LRRTLGATPRALTLALKDLVDAGIVERRVHDEFPPGTSYRLTSAGRALRNRVTRLEVALENLRPNELDVKRRRVYRQTRKRAHKAEMRARRKA
jgi:DNA-binding HxlR family transcriptional regulator